MIDPFLAKHLRREVDLKQLLAALDFSDEEVVEVSKQQPMLFMEAVRFRVQSMRERTVCEAKLLAAKSTLGGKFRTKLKEGGEKVTEGQVQERIGRDKDIRAMEEELAESEQAEEWSKLLLEAFRMRRDAMKVVADVIGAEMYISKMNSGAATELGKLGKVKSKLEEKYPARRK